MATGDADQPLKAEAAAQADADAGDCSTVRFHEVLHVEQREIGVWRCDWGWRVKWGDRVARSRFLDEALEAVIGRLGPRATAAVVAVLERELTAEQRRTGRTAFATVAPDAVDAPSASER
ncbi:MAG: hypothetical protein ICV64_05705 [Thermoleophilia bacterium]|nr:hypothetical protein [Thermoleophilia bacterium]